MQANQLSLNVDKTQFMTFSPKKRVIPQEIKITLNNIAIKEVVVYKFLGILVDNKISWKPHVQQMTRKISKSVVS